MLVVWGENDAGTITQALTGFKAETPSATLANPVHASSLQIAENYESFADSFITSIRRTFREGETAIRCTTFVVPTYPADSERKYRSSQAMTARGLIHIFHGNPKINHEADRVFEEYQRVASAKSFFQRHVSHVSYFISLSPLLMQSRERVCEIDFEYVLSLTCL